MVQAPNSPTPQEDHRMPQTSSSEKWDNLDEYDKFINEHSVRIESGRPPADHTPYDEDLLRHTLGFSPRVKEDKETYPVSDIERNRLSPQLDSDKGTESEKKSTSIITAYQRLKEQFSEDEELLFPQGLPLKEDNINSKIRSHNREIFMAFLSDLTN
jgi:hypothetical protein